MGRKRNPVLPIFTRDILSSPRCRALSASAAGVYFFLLCRMNEPPQPGAYRLSDWEQHPNWRRSKTQQCLATADKYERLQYFAALLAKNDLPWRQKDILSGLQELYDFGILTVEGDMLIQPRMYKDNGFALPDLDGDGDPEGTILDDPASGSMSSKDGSELSENSGVKSGTQKRAKKSTEKVQRNAPVSYAGAGLKRDRDRDNNIDNSSKGIVGGVGDFSRKDEAGGTSSVPSSSAARNNGENNPDNGGGVQKSGFKREKNGGTGNLSSDGRKREETSVNGLHGQNSDGSTTARINNNGCTAATGGSDDSQMIIDGHPETDNDTGPLFSEFWEAYDKQVNMIEAEAYWGVLSRQDKEAIMDYIPRYKIAQPRKQFRKNPVTFLRMRAWLDEIITDTRIDISSNDRQATTTNQRGGYAGAGRTQEQEAADGREQTMRIVSRIFADQDARREQAADGGARGADSGGDPF